MSDMDGKALLEHGRGIARRFSKQVGPDVAEELQAEAVARVLRHPSPDGRQQPWLERVFRNLLIDWLRRRRPIAMDLDAFPDVRTPEDAALLHERRRLVRAGLRGLPPNARRVLLSRYYAELDDAATAVRLGIAGGTVRTRIHRALARLRDRLGDLRALCPPILGKLSGMLVSAGLAPMVVATLLAGGPIPRATTPTAAMATLPTITVHRLPSRESRRDGMALSVSSASAPARARVSKKSAVVGALASGVAVPVAAPAAASASAQILWPEAVDVRADPEAPAQPLLLAPPASFAGQIEKMVEEHP